MEIKDYLAAGRHFKDRGYATDGCSLVGWFVHRIWPKLEAACWSHDYARRELIDIDQYTNDKLFKDSLKHLGAPRLLRWLMYSFVRIQGVTGLRLDIFLGLLVFVTFLITSLWFGVVKAEGLEVDPTITPTWTLTCNYPVERADGTTLALSEIAKVSFFVSPDKVDWRPAGENTTNCRQVYDLSQVADGQYYYTVTATDTYARESIYGANAVPPEIVALLVKRIQAPRPPTGLSGSAS